MHAADTVCRSTIPSMSPKRRFVLLERNLRNPRIEEGRKTFASTMKYVDMTSANLGNMLSMAAASLPAVSSLLAGQILNNLRRYSDGRRC
jgi:hypothetical protein